MEHSFGNGWASSRAVQAINGTTRSIYEYYRLRDVTVFGDASPIKLRLGGPDRVSIKFIGDLDHFYFSKFADNTREPMRKFFTERFFENGSLLFDQNTTAWRDFKEAGGDKFKNLTYRQTKTIIETATARTRNWAQIASLRQGNIELTKLVATLDSRTSAICEFLDGKIIRVAAAQDAIQRLNKLEPAEFALQLYNSPLSKEMAKNPIDTIKQFLEADGVTISDALVETGRGMPPFHPNCRTRTEEVIEGVDDAASEQ